MPKFRLFHGQHCTDSTKCSFFRDVSTDSIVLSKDEGFEALRMWMNTADGCAYGSVEIFSQGQEFTIDYRLCRADDDTLFGELDTLYIREQFDSVGVEKCFFEGIPCEGDFHISIPIIVFWVTKMFFEVESFHYFGRM